MAHNVLIYSILNIFQALQQLTKSHVDSFNYMLEEGLHNVVQVFAAICCTL